MSYWEKNAEKIEIPAYKNDFGQTISVGDHVHYPTWYGDFSDGHVKKIVEFDAETWDYKQQKSVPCKRQYVYVQREVDVYRYNYKTNKRESNKQRRTFKIYYSRRVVKLYPDEVF